MGITRRMAYLAIGLFAGAVIAAGCGSDEPVDCQAGGTAANGSAMTSSCSPPAGGAQVGTGTVDAFAEPVQARQLLEDNGIANGDIYLQDGRLFINIVGLDEADAAKALFASVFRPDSYVLVDAVFTHNELLAEQERLSEEGLYQSLNLYGSSVDVINNRVVVTLPDDAEDAAREAFAGQLGSGLVALDVQELGEPHVSGEIVQTEAVDGRFRILILEEGQENPSYWFTFTDASESFDADGAALDPKTLEQGMKVDLWSTGTVLESFPAQATVRRLEVAAD